MKGKTVAERITAAQDRVRAMMATGQLNTPEKAERAAELIRSAIRRAVAQRIVDLVGENVGIPEACAIAFAESGLKVTQEQVSRTARTFEENWEAFVKSAPVEVVSDAEFAALVEKGGGS